MYETWYVLENGNAADPAEVYHDGTGYRHQSGVAVAMRGPEPSTRGVNPDEERAKIQPEEAPKARRGYKTRESKAD
jgi:hypothetical protein